MQVNFDNNKNISYDSAGREIVEEKNSTNSAFANDLDEAQKSNEQNSKNEEKEKELTTKEKQEVTDKLVEDIMSLFKTGLTVEELEMIQKLLDEIKKKISEEKLPLNSNDIKEIDSLLTKLELMIMQLQKRAKGEAVIDMEDSPTNDISKENKSSSNKSISLAVS